MAQAAGLAMSGRLRAQGGSGTARARGEAPGRQGLGSTWLPRGSGTPECTCPAAPPASARRDAECCRAVLPSPPAARGGHGPGSPSRDPWARSAPRSITSLQPVQPNGGKAGGLTAALATCSPAPGAAGISARSQMPVGPLPGAERADTSAAAVRACPQCHRTACQLFPGQTQPEAGADSQQQGHPAPSLPAVGAAWREPSPFSTWRHGPVERLAAPHGASAERVHMALCRCSLQQDVQDRRSRQSEGPRESRGGRGQHPPVSPSASACPCTVARGRSWHRAEAGQRREMEG